MENKKKKKKKAETSSEKLPEENADNKDEKVGKVISEVDFSAGKKELPKIGYGPG
jgi:flagellar motility protein MotE (MotC chaperone)